MTELSIGVYRGSRKPQVAWPHFVRVCFSWLAPRAAERVNCYGKHLLIGVLFDVILRAHCFIKYGLLLYLGLTRGLN